MNQTSQFRSSPFARKLGIVFTMLFLVSAFAVAESQHSITVIASTVPANGDVNPYGIFVVPTSTGSLVKGNLLISNFNASSNAQGTGTTLVQISPSGAASQFAQNFTPKTTPPPPPPPAGATRPHPPSALP